MHCPNCGKDMSRMNNDQKYLLTELGPNNSVNIGSGLVVNALGCVNCGCIVLHNPDIIGAKVTHDK